MGFDRVSAAGLGRLRRQVLPLVDIVGVVVGVLVDQRRSVPRDVAAISAASPERH